ncbi:molybdenum cofactor guanylyltransferase [Oxynema aestuarii]|jgi:molybdopterin-guanine dinucleotide biosynthesis protein A|uniref:Probable molybdenum cofactor guanylyltransferase n=1 Tax=Oxynema aestuarii AP17 TaxID=2064643 RepID=A0A6H1U2Y6_9CYAN|nr:molybdenum cofactor guanylyltransferase [Oxynema aestuarii]QIZ73232.1 molybdenum cofactor guanylyltransferase [Oxynema aestuarii AP17]
MLKNRLTALVLAGGSSSRMGQDKALLTVGGRTFLQKVCEVARQCCDRVCILTPWPERYQFLNELPSWGAGEIAFLDELHPGEGPLVALCDGLAQVESEWVLLLACDLPFLDGAIVARWAAQLDALSPEILASVPQQDSLWQPTCGFYRSPILPHLQGFVARGGRSFQRGLRELPVQAIALNSAESQMLLNVNTPEAFRSLQN